MSFPYQAAPVPTSVPQDVRRAHTGCICAEHFDVTLLDGLRLVVNGAFMSQVEASRQLWGADVHQPQSVAIELGLDAAARARQEFGKAFPWLSGMTAVFPDQHTTTGPIKMITYGVPAGASS